MGDLGHFYNFCDTSGTNLECVFLAFSDSAGYFDYLIFQAVVNKNRAVVVYAG